MALVGLRHQFSPVSWAARLPREGACGQLCKVLITFPKCFPPLYPSRRLGLFPSLPEIYMLLILDCPKPQSVVGSKWVHRILQVSEGDVALLASGAQTELQEHRGEAGTGQ